MSTAAIFAELVRGYMNDDTIQMLDDIVVAAEAMGGGNSNSSTSINASHPSNPSNGASNDNCEDSAEIDNNVLPEIFVDNNSSSSDLAGSGSGSTEVSP